ncbi:MAG: PTS sugar transporter subunit IIA [Peptoniphilaceae bacterium]|nr:PTS sugar transporter subunit IIA [Peptoniphilaceae bacterium]MDD7382897.1 PTS sugar transporter subunit IIA [Peptoniphilaceae bacterium]MDY3737648.1 PTS sugar transporter subunit IIA [Peptoniphilaceae bacterium]
MEYYLDKELIFKDLEVTDNKEALKILSTQLFKKNMVLEDYISEVISREIEYPTGLFTGKINIAIPHCDYKFVKKKSIAIATLKKPIKFKKMDEPNEYVPVSIIMMIAIDNPDNHIEFLKKLFKLVQNQNILKDLYSSKSKEDILNILNENI